MSTKLNWGTGLALSLGAFMLFILSFLWRAITSDTVRGDELVSSRAYEEGLEHERTLVALRNAAALDGALQVDTKAIGGVSLRIAPAALRPPVRGQIKWVRPGDPAASFELPLSVSAEGSQLVPWGLLREGAWRLTITWDAGNVPYRVEQELYLSPPPAVADSQSKGAADVGLR